ncbi:MAG: DUF4419 domain-containing protein [Kofleriaceae bacterium]
MVTFRVSDVERTGEALVAIDPAAHIAALGYKQVEAFQVAAETLVQGPLVHPLALAVDLAFRLHRPLVITPDAVWSCLAQSLATHVDMHAETLRPRLVRHAGQLELEVRFDDFIRGDPTNDWSAAIDALTAKLREHLGGRAQLFVADFSTTGPIERTASQVILMSAMRQLFRYSVGSLCGIPEITLAGTVADWVAIRERAKAFDDFALDWWLAHLDPVLATFEATARGSIDVEHWKTFYKAEYESGGERSYGWFNALFAYTGDPPQRSEFPGFDAESFSGHKLSDYPTGRARTPFTWKFPDAEHAMELVGGLLGVTEDARGALSCAAGWIVAQPVGDSGFRRTNGTWLTPRDETLETLEGLVHEASDDRVTVSIFHGPRLRSLAGIEHLRGLEELTVCSPLLESVAPLAGRHMLRGLSLGDCPKLGGVGAVLATLPQLTTLSLMNNSQLPRADFLPIAQMTQLHTLTTWRCEGLPEHLRGAFRGLEACTAARAQIAALGE